MSKKFVIVYGKDFVNTVTSDPIRVDNFFIIWVINNFQKTKNHTNFHNLRLIIPVLLNLKVFEAAILVTLIKRFFKLGNHRDRK